jgi:Flp pilus assembly protein TadD/glutathione synthase/RimK-type ligase-like ATP-grasp enzyme
VATACESGPAGFDAALALHRAGRLDQARAAYESLLAPTPDDPNLLGLLGVVALQRNRAAEAEELLCRAVSAVTPEPRAHLRNVNNLIALLKSQGREDAARALAGAELPGWPPDAPPDAAERATVLSLVEALARYGQPERALSLLEDVLAHLGEDSEALNLAGRLRLMRDEVDAALADLERAAACDPGNWQPLAALSVAHERLGHGAEARAAARRCARAAPVFVTPRQDGQQATILVLNSVPGRIRSADSGLHGLHFHANYISQASVLMAGEFRFASAFADLPAALPDLPGADLVFSNMASGEWMNVPGRLDRAVSLVERIGRPVINHPNAIFRVTRQKAAGLLQGIPGLRVPRIMRYARDIARLDEIAADVADNFAYPVIVRHVAADESSKSLLSDKKTALLVADADELRAFVKSVAWPEFYVIQYVDLRKADGNFRKLRAVFLADEAIIGSGGYYSEWMVGGWRRLQAGQEFYNRFPHLVGQMNRILLDPEGSLGPQIMPVLEAVRDRIQLDVFGMDFDVDDDGQVVPFEVGATMNFLQRTTAPEHLRMPMDLEDRVNAAFRRLVRSTIAREQ